MNSTIYNHRGRTQHCVWCIGRHHVAKYRIFLELEGAVRREKVRRVGLWCVCSRGGRPAGECLGTNRCSIVDCGDGQHLLLHTTARRLHERNKMTCNGHCTVARLRNVFALLGIIPVKLRSADLGIVGEALLDNGSDKTLILVCELAQSGLRHTSESLTMKLSVGPQGSNRQ